MNGWQVLGWVGITAASFPILAVSLSLSRALWHAGKPKEESGPIFFKADD